MALNAAQDPGGLPSASGMRMRTLLIGLTFRRRNFKIGWQRLLLVWLNHVQQMSGAPGSGVPAALGELSKTSKLRRFAFLTMSPLLIPRHEGDNYSIL